MKPRLKNGVSIQFKLVTAFSLIGVAFVGNEFILPHHSIAMEKSAIPVSVKELADDTTIGDRVPPFLEPGVEPVPIPESELPPPLPPNQGIVFREIQQGGIAGKTKEILVFKDGRVMINPEGDMNQSPDAIVPPQMVLQFQRLLERREFAKFNNLSYPATSGADFITYTLTSPNGTVQYNDLSYESLPSDLRTVVDAWNRLLRNLTRNRL